MNPCLTIAAALLLAAPFTTTPAAVTPPMVTPVAASAAASRPAASVVRSAPARPNTLPVGAETLPADWLEAVEPGLSKAVRSAPAPVPVPGRPAAR